MQTSFAALSDLNILVVEDEALIAMMLEDILAEFGCIVHVAPTIDAAVEALWRGLPDGALLDMNIHGTKPVAVAEELARRSVPFLLVTGYGAGESDHPAFRAAPRLQKPFSGDQLGRCMVDVFRPRAGEAA